MIVIPVMLSVAIIHDRENRTSGHAWPHSFNPLRSSMIAKIKRAAILGRTLQ
ncbi:hypothetical protein ABQJ54_02295 [Rhodanobacter sp. Si-c]|uniref:Uncharacterized protein n=1 Tax=Rhodanobacter lycopersici TaxID=3162487 RepID=A0ABV3QBN3_9GAMM